MKPTPIFDTNIFGWVQQKLISKADWNRLLRHRPRHGWRLSSVTALELLAGFDGRPHAFLDAREQIALAYELSKGRILDDARFLICKEVLHVPIPDQPHIPCRELGRQMDVIRRAKSLDQLKTGIPYTLWRGVKLEDSSAYDNVMAGPKSGWITAVEQMADEIYPHWREEKKRSGKRLPPEKQKVVKEKAYWQRGRASFIEGLLKWLGASTDAATVTEMSRRLDALLALAVFVSREFLLNDYSLEKNTSDIFDQFQLQYLAIDKYVIVTADERLWKRTRQSSQAYRIIRFDEFLQSL